MARELILIPKAKYELLTKEDTLTKSVDTTVTKDLKTIKTTPDAQRIEEEDKNIEPHIDVLQNTISYVIPKNALRKAMGLWNFLKDRKGTVVNWNDLGEVSVHGQTISGSHVIDLLKHTVSPLSKTEPTGYLRFYEALQEMHTPTGFLAQHTTPFESEETRHNNSIQQGLGKGFVKGKMEKGPPGQKQKQFRWIPY